MNLERALAPLALVVAVVALVVWLMLVNDISIGPWLLALLVFAHGWVHLMFVFPKPESPSSTLEAAGSTPDGPGSTPDRPGYDGGGEYPFDFGRSWLIRGLGLGLGVVRPLGLGVMAVTFGLSLLAALATVGLLVPTEWWGPLMIGAAVASTVMLVLFFSPALILGFAINAAMVVLVLSDSWSPA